MLSPLPAVWPSSSPSAAAVPTADGRPTASELAGFIVAYYRVPGHEVGYTLHIVLDDGNYRDSHVRFCLRAAVAVGDRFGIKLARMLLAASRTQRSAAAKGAHVMMQLDARRQRDHAATPHAVRRLSCWHD